MKKKTKKKEWKKVSINAPTQANLLIFLKNQILYSIISYQLLSKKLYRPNNN